MVLACRIALLAVWSLAANGQPRAIDTARSTMTIRVYKTGVLSVLGHDHEISAPVARGTVDVPRRTVELHIETGALQVRDPKASGKDRQEIQTTMLGSEVLDEPQYKQIDFQSTGAEGAGTGVWKVTGKLTLHGMTRPVTLEVREKDNHFAGACQLKITDFGIKPVKAAGGSISVKDEVRIEFAIELAH
jgi:polyisoprenoid-binding protein YceI